MDSFKSFVATCLALVVVVGIGIAVIFGGVAIWSHLRVFNATSVGKAELAQAEQNRQILVTQAKAEREAAEQRSEAIRIMGQAAKDFPEYRQQEFMASFGEALREGKMNQVIYVPTEANVPIMEAGRMTGRPPRE